MVICLLAVSTRKPKIQYEFKFNLKLKLFTEAFTYKKFRGGITILPADGYSKEAEDYYEALLIAKEGVCVQR